MHPTILATCPRCGAPETVSSTPRTIYACGSSDYDQRPGTFQPSPTCQPKASTIQQQVLDQLRAAYRLLRDSRKLTPFWSARHARAGDLLLQATDQLAHAVALQRKDENDHQPVTVTLFEHPSPDQPPPVHCSSCARPVSPNEYDPTLGICALCFAQRRR